jgi:hypothetical protein
MPVDAQHHNVSEIQIRIQLLGNRKSQITNHKSQIISNDQKPNSKQKGDFEYKYILDSVIEILNFEII